MLEGAIAFELAMGKFVEATVIGVLLVFNAAYTPTRVPEGERFALVRAFMAHHQGMTIAGIANAVFDGAMRVRFHAEPNIQAGQNCFHRCAQERSLWRCRP